MVYYSIVSFIQALGTLFEEVLTASGPARSQRTKLKQDLENFLQYFGDRGQPSYITRNLLKAFEQVNGEVSLVIFWYNVSK